MASYFTLDSTFAGGSSNTYVASVAEAKAVRASLGAMAGFGIDFAGFDAAADDVLVDTAVLAAASLDGLSFPGFKKLSSQAMQWPRVSVRRPNLENVIPDGVRFAQVAEMAALLSAPDANAAAAAAGVSSYTAGKKSVTYDADRAALARSAKVSEPTRRVLARFGLVAGPVSTVYMPRG